MKVYFARANRAHQEDVAKVLEELYQFDIEVLKYEKESGAYTNDDLLTCDMLIVLPEHLGTNMVGLGLATQITDFSENSPDGRMGKIQIIKSLDDDDIMIDSLMSIRLVDPKNWMNHSSIVTLGEPKTLFSLFKEKETV